jgi:ADP-heptose:LPS heptosyltransferase
MKNILLIRFKSIGDVVLTLPAVHAMRKNFPSAKITFLTSKENAPLLRGFREVNEIVALDRAALRTGNPFRALPEFFSLLRHLRGGKFSLAVDFQGYGETELLSWWSGAPQRWGSVYGAGREWLYTRVVMRDNNIQIADQNLSLLERCGLKTGRICNEFILPDYALAEAKKIFTEKKLDAAKPTLFIQPFTSEPKKNWPLENFILLAEHWRSHGVQVLFGGGPADRARLDLARQRGFMISAGASLLASAGLMQLSTVVGGGVTGLLHLAVAMQKRVVMLAGYPATEAGLPYQHYNWAVVPATGGRISEIQIGEVIAACGRALAEAGASQ